MPAAADTALAKVHYIVALSGLVLMMPGIVMALTERGETLAVVGSLLTFASILIFLFTVARHRTA